MQQYTQKYIFVTEVMHLQHHNHTLTRSDKNNRGTNSLITVDRPVLMMSGGLLHMGCFDI